MKMFKYQLICTTSLAALCLFVNNTFAFTYSVNTIWINEKANSEKYVFPKIRTKPQYGRSADQTDVVEWIKVWLQANPDANFIFWYDSETVTREQVNKTNELFTKLQQSILTGHTGVIQLKSIYDSPTVARYKKYFSISASLPTPLYLLVDLLRIALGLDVLESCENNKRCFFIYADIDKGLGLILSPLQFDYTRSCDLRAKYLLDEDTLKGLLEYGLVLRGKHENNFFIMSNDKIHMLEALRIVVLESNFKRIDELHERSNELYKKFPEGKLKIAPINKHINKIEDFEKLSPDLVLKLRAYVYDANSLVYRSMILGPLMIYFNYLEGKINLQKNQEGDFAELFSRFHLKHNLTSEEKHENSKIFEISGTQLEPIDMIRALPTKQIGGSIATSPQIDWQ